MSLKLLHVCSVAPLGEMRREEPFETSFLVLLPGSRGFPMERCPGCRSEGEEQKELGG